MTTALSDQGIQFASGNIVDVRSTMPSSGTYTAGDFVLESTTSPFVTGWKRLTTGSGHVLGTDWAKVPGQSMVRLNTANGYGSTNNKIRRFTTTVTNQGSDISYADSTTLGGTFTINTAGVYAISYTDEFSVADWMGLSLNSSQLTTSILSITASTRLCEANNTNGGVANTVSWTGYLAVNDVVRAHTGGSATGANGSTQFTIVRVA